MISAEDENTAVLVEPLYPDKKVLSIDVISETAERLVKYGVPPERLVIGLSAWARGYELIDGNQTDHEAPVYGVFQLPETVRDDGRFAYQEICDLVDHSGLIYHEKAAAVSFVVNDTQFFSYNPPTHEVVRRKVQWISSHGFGSIGVTQMEADDPNNRCENGVYPLHSVIARSFKCSKRHRDVDRTTSCNRACIYRPNCAPIAFEDLTPEWCSHLILSSAGITYYVNWAVTKKPWLVLSIGADVPIDDWQKVLANSTARRVFVQSARQFLVDNNARGIELSHVSDESPADVLQMRSNFDALLEDLRNELPRKTLLFVTVTSSWTFAEVYNSTTLNLTADFIILEGHRFHRSNAVFTGHHSPLFSDPLLLDNTNKSID
ncbi:hypothetical protein M3Y99_01801700 [Aphelenchoides fujianensis]|nr:hypothetical protein M3Y99_01801700 [Aphelenchoides fujianensis]